MVHVGAFVGIAASNPGDGQIPDMLRRADIALDRAKSTRSARPVWFDEGMERALIIHSELEQGIRYGLDHGQFMPYFEPQVDLLTGEIIGFEVLARWDHPLSGMIEPDRFIPIAEEHGLIGRLSEQIMLAAMTEAAGWDPSIKLSVNISPSQLTDSWLAQRIVRLLTEAGFPAERLVVEITESSLFCRPGSRPDDRHQPQEPGYPACARRFRHRLFLAGPFALAAVRRDQDRPQLCCEPGEGSGKLGDHPGGDDAGRWRSACRSPSRASRMRRPMRQSPGSAAQSGRAGISASR